MKHSKRILRILFAANILNLAVAISATLATGESYVFEACMFVLNIIVLGIASVIVDASGGGNE